MSDLTIFYLSDKPSVVSTLKEYLGEQSIKFSPYPLEVMPSVDYLMLIEPLKIRGEAYAISKVWKPWLFKNAPDTHLIIATFTEDILHPNTLNLLDLPEVFRDWLRQVYPISAYALESGGMEEIYGTKREKWIDPWERFLPRSGHDIKKQMKQFISGHDAHNSFFEQTSRLRKHVVDLKTPLAEPAVNISLTHKDQICHKEALLKNINKEWNYLAVRWQYYRPLFEFLPFQGADHKIDKYLNIIGGKIKKLYHSDESIAVQDLEFIQEIVNKEIKPYIYAKDYW